jgi:site-specific DNA recombinase
MNRAVLYLRSSKDRHDVSLDAQRRALEDLAAATNLAIIGEYRDEVESGGDEDRPGFQRLYRDLRAKARQWTHILVLDTSRLARRMDTAIWFEEREAALRGVTVVYKSLPDIDPVYRQLFKRQLQAMDEFHSMISRQKGLAGMRENVHQGWRAGGRAPFGYRLVHTETGKTRDQMPVTKSRLEPSIDAGKIATYLSDRAAGIPRLKARDRAGIELRDTTLIGIERNALTYAGHTVWNVHNEYRRGGYPGAVKRRPRSEWIIRRDTHPALITEAEAETILANHSERSRRRAREGKRVYLLAGLLHAPGGAAWHGDSGNYRLGKGRKVDAARLEHAVVECMAINLVDDAVVKDLAARFRRIYKGEEDATELRSLVAQIAEASRKIERVGALLAQTSAPDALLRSIEKWETERTKLLNRKIELEERTKLTAQLHEVRESDVRRILQHMAEEVDETQDPGELKDLLAGFLDGVELDPVTFSCTMRYRIDPLRRGDNLASPRHSALIPHSGKRDKVASPGTLAIIPPIIYERSIRVEPNRSWNRKAA